MPRWASFCLSIMIAVGILLPSGTPSRADTGSVYDLVDYDAAMHDHIAALTTIEAYSGWRSAGTSGEAQAADYIAEQLSQFTTLNGTISRDEFAVYATLETHHVGLELHASDTDYSVMVDAPRGNINDLASLQRMDTDGALGDTDPHPIDLTQPIVMATTAAELAEIYQDGIAGKILVLDYALIDPTVTLETDRQPRIDLILANPPAAIILTTHDSTTIGASHGTYLAEARSLIEADTEGVLPPLVFVRSEDLGANGWNGIESATITLDMDVISPATSQNVIYHIAGADSSRAMILGASIDSPNTPGALDNAVGAASLLEVARVLDASATQPPVDLYLVWFGAEEIGGYGSAHFAITHQDIVAQTVAMLSVEGITAPIGGIRGGFDLMTWTYARMGYYQSQWGNVVRDLTDARDIAVTVRDVYTVAADNSIFNVFGVPNVNIAYHNLVQMTTAGGVIYAGHTHSPYDTLEKVDAQADVVENAVRIALTAVLEGSEVDAPLSNLPTRDKQAVIIATHTESPLMASVGMIEFAMTLHSYGYAVEIVPYGTSFTAETLDGAEMVMVLPPYDYETDDATQAYTAEEAATIEAYIAEGGFALFTNTGNRIHYDNSAWDVNEDRFGLNPVTEPLGVRFIEGEMSLDQYGLLVDTPIFDGVNYLDIGEETAVPFTTPVDSALVGVSATEPLIAGFNHGAGLVLVVGDMGIFSNRVFVPGEALYENPNITFWQNFLRIAGG